MYDCGAASVVFGYGARDGEQVNDHHDPQDGEESPSDEDERGGPANNSQAQVRESHERLIQVEFMDTELSQEEPQDIGHGSAFLVGNYYSVVYIHWLL